MTILAYILSSISLLMAFLLFVKSGPPPGFYVMFAKLMASAMSAYWAVIGALGAILGILFQAYWAIPIGIAGMLIMAWHVWSCTRDHKGFEDAFGPGWSDSFTPLQKEKMLRRRWSFYLKMKGSPEPIWDRNVPFWTISGTDRQLLCDIWRPADGKVSGLAFIYFHGSAWAVGDKDMLTRNFFRHLVSQGHIVMDVAYRLCPEVDIFEMVGDVKRSIAWMKTNASQYGVNPEKVIIGGGSAGGHLALLAAYTNGHPELTPKELADANLSVPGVVSFYGPSDFLAEYECYMWKKFYSKNPPLPIGTILEPKMRMQYAGRLDMLLGGHPKEALHTYQIASPINHVHPDCPPTLMMQAEQDLLVPIESTRALYSKLVEAGVPAINRVFYGNDHAFDLAAPYLNPAAQSSLYDVDRFLALLLNKA